MPSSRRRSGVVIVALVLALAGCGSGDAKDSGDAKPVAPQGSDPVAWIGAFCGGPNGVITGAAAVGEALGKAQPTPQGQKDALLAFADSSQRAMADAARKLEQLGSPSITDGKRIHDTAVSFFRSAAESVAGQRAKLAALDPNDPEYLQKLSGVVGPDLDPVSTQLQQLTSSNQELVPAFHASPECQRLRASTGSR